MDAAVAITGTAVKCVLEKVTTWSELSLLEKAKIAFEASKDPNVTFMCGNHDLEFRGTVAGMLLMPLTDLERRKINYELRTLAALSFMLRGGSIGEVPTEDEEVTSIECGLMGLFRESRGL